MHGFRDCLDFLQSTKLDIPEADPFVVLYINHLIRGVVIASTGPCWAMLRHFSDTSMTTSTWIYFDTFDILPKRVRIQSWLNWAISSNNAHVFDLVLIFQENFESLVHNSILQGFHISLILLCKDGLWNQEIRQLVWKNVNLEFYLVSWILHILWICRINHSKCDSLDYLWRLSHLRAIISIHCNQIEWALGREKDFDALDTTADELSLLNPRVLIPWHEAVSGKFL